MNPERLKEIRDEIRLAIAESDSEFDLRDDETGEPDLSNADIDRLADIAVNAIEGMV